MALTQTSAAFADGGAIPRKYTCEGSDVSPPLAWAGVPRTAKSLALIVDDPDAPDPAAPKLTWVHWVLYNLPPSADGLVEDHNAHGLPAGSAAGRNDWKRSDYGGPCPPIGRHRYFHKLYALDCVLENLKQPTKAQLLAAMSGHVVAEAQLIGTYEKK
jgi:Raf kinase inhibitor-like YbhB/YbcL family protein